MLRFALIVLGLVFSLSARADDLKILPIAEIADPRRPPNDFVMRGETLFVVDGGQAEFLVYDLSNPAAPKKVYGETFDDYDFQAIWVSAEGIAYIVGPMGLTVFDVRKPDRTSLLGHHWLVDDVRLFLKKTAPIAMVRDTLFVCSQRVGLMAIDLNNPVKPRLQGVAKFFGAGPRGVVGYRGSTLLYADPHGIATIDVKDPTRMAFARPDDTGYLKLEKVIDLEVSSDPTIAFALAPGPTLYTLDLAKPEVAATLDLEKAAQGREVYDISLSPDDRLLLCGTNRGLCAVNVVDPRNPKAMDRRYQSGLYVSRFYGDLLVSRGTSHKVVVQRVSGTETIGTIGTSRTERGSEARQHKSKRPRTPVHPKDGEANVQTYEIAWKPVRRSGRGHYTTYTVGWRAFTDELWSEVDVEVVASRPRHVLTELAPNRKHFVRIRTRLEDDESSPWSAAHSFQTPSPQPTWATDDPISVTATNAMVRWAVPEGAERAFQAFTVFVRPRIPGPQQVYDVRDSAARSFLVEGLPPNTEYVAQIQGIYEPLNVTKRTPPRLFKTNAE